MKLSLPWKHGDRFTISHLISTTMPYGTINLWPRTAAKCGLKRRTKMIQSINLSFNNYVSINERFYKMVNFHWELDEWYKTAVSFTFDEITVVATSEYLQNVFGDVLKIDKAIAQVKQAISEGKTEIIFDGEHTE
jgi:hypothetical protein